MTLPIVLEKKSPIPLHRQIYHEIQRLILSEIWRPGTRLPSTRDLSVRLKVSRATVCMAYEQLLLDGYLQSFTGSGTYVSREIPDRRFLKRQEEQINITPIRPVPDNLLSSFGEFLQTREEFAPEQHEQQEAGEIKSEESLVWRRILSRRVKDESLPDACGDASGLDPLRDVIAGYVSRTRGVICEAGQIVITGSKEEALDLIARMHIEENDVVAVEDPGDPTLREILLSHAADLDPIPVDGSGLMVDRLINSEHLPPKMLVLTPSCQMPLGVSLSRFRRHELMKWCVESRTLVVEDDTGNELSYGGQSLRSLQGLANGGLVIYMGTFKKILPAVRLCFLVVPKSLAVVYNRAMSLAGSRMSVPEQFATMDLITHGVLDKIVRRARASLDQKRVLIADVLRRLFGPEVQIHGGMSGTSLIVRLTRDVQPGLFGLLSQRCGVSITSTNRFYVSANHNQGEFIVNFAAARENDLIGFVNEMAAHQSQTIGRSHQIAVGEIMPVVPPPVTFNTSAG